MIDKTSFFNLLPLHLGQTFSLINLLKSKPIKVVSGLKNLLSNSAIIPSNTSEIIVVFPNLFLPFTL